MSNFHAVLKMGPGPNLQGDMKNMKKGTDKVACPFFIYFIS